MIDKWNKLRILIEWLEQGRELEIEDERYAISKDGNIIKMYFEDKGIEITSLAHIWNLIEKIDEGKLFIMSSETALTNLKKR